MTKEYLKMADVFFKKLDPADFSLKATSVSVYMDDGVSPHEYAAHAINSHDELVEEVERLRGALTSSRLALSNAAMNMKWFDISKAQEILREVNAIDKSISAIGKNDAKI